MTSYPTERLRNVGLFAHGSAGKTSLAEAILFNVSATTRLGRVEEGTTVSDYDPDEIKRHISVQCSLLPCDWKGTKINLIDTPGYADFVGEVREAIRVVDAALLILEAVAGVEVGTELVWRFADEYQRPRLVFINKMDRDNADFYRTLDQLRERLAPNAVPLQLPLGTQAQFEGVVDLVRLKALRGAKGEEAEIPPDLKVRAQEYREKVVEAAAETSDELIAKYLEGEELSAEEIVGGLRAAVAGGKIVPVLCGSALANKAIGPLMDAIVSYLPSPLDTGPIQAHHHISGQEVVLESAPTEALAVLAFKTTADPYVGRLTYLRVYSGVLYSDSHVWNANKGREERIGQLYSLRGKAQEPVAQLEAGEVGAVAKLQETSTGDTLCSKERPVLLAGITFPTPSFAAAVEPKTKADLDKLGTALLRLAEEDPTLQVRKEQDTGETILAGMGESHVDIAAEKMHRKFGVDVLLHTPKVPYKETILTPTKAEYKHKKQTGGHGQYGHVFLELTPLPRGAGFEFAERVVGGVVPRQYIPAVEKGVREAIQEGVLAGYPVVDIKVTLYDGSYHVVDSSEISFKIASATALRKGLQQGNPVLLEPIVNLTVTVPEEYMGDVMGDLNAKRTRVLGMETAGGISVIRAQGPLAELQRYATALRSLTGGRGTYTMEFDRYEEVPGHLAQQIIAEAKKQKQES